MNPKLTAAVISGAMAAGVVVLKARESLRLLSGRRDAVRRYRAKLEAKAKADAPEG